MQRKKILLISYYYLPNIMAASLRIHAWAKYLKALEWEPVILTYGKIRNQKNYAEVLSHEISHEINNEIKCLVYRVDCNPLHEKLWCYKKKLEIRSDSSKNEVLIRKLLGFLFRNFLFLPDEKISWYKNAYRAAVEIIRKHSIKIILSTGAPWTDFKIAYNINKKIGIPWIADYRDPWTQITTLGIKKRDLIWLILSRIYEKRITKTASEIIHIAESYSKELERILKRKIHFIPNGYDPHIFEKYCDLSPGSDILKLSCIGTKHPSENSNIFLKGFQLFVINNKISPNRCKIEFIGNGHERIKKEFEDFHKIENYISFKPPVLHHKAVQAMYKSHLLLLFSSNIEGVCSAKIFDYLASKRKILVTPDGENIGIVRKIINDANAGVILNNPKQIEQWLRKCYKEFLKTGKIESSTKLSEIEKYDRKKQVKMLSQILEKVIKRNSL